VRHRFHSVLKQGGRDGAAQLGPDLLGCGGAHGQLARNCHTTLPADLTTSRFLLGMCKSTGQNPLHHFRAAHYDMRLTHF